MSAVLVVDASVALKWVMTEVGSDQASDLLTQLAQGASALVAPEHLVGEVGNGLRKRVAQGVLSTDDALSALDAIAALELELVDGADRWFRSLPAALDWELSGTPEVTASTSADRRLAAGSGWEVAVQGAQQGGQAADGPAVPPRASGHDDPARVYDRASVSDQGVQQGAVLAQLDGPEPADGRVRIAPHGQVGAVHMIMRSAAQPIADDPAVRP